MISPTGEELGMIKEDSMVATLLLCFVCLARVLCLPVILSGSSPRLDERGERDGGFV